MTKQEMIVRIADKCQEQRDWITDAEAKVRKGELSKNTLQTQKYSRGKEVNLLTMIQTLLAGNELSADMWKQLESYTMPSVERKAMVLTINKGDSVLEIMQKYPNCTMAKINEYCAKHGLTVNGIVVE